MKIYKEESLQNFEFWSRAKANAATLTSEQLDTVESILEELYPEGIEDTQINNNIFWFDFDQVREWLGLEPEE